MTLQPFTGELDDDTNLIPFDGELDEESWFDKAKGAGEAGLNMMSTIPAALGGGINYLGTLAATQDPDAAMAVKQGTEKTINDYVEYDPRTEAGKRYKENIQKGMEHTIDYGGKTLQSMNRTSRLNFDEDAIDAIGRAGTEMALNVVDPLAAGAMVRGGLRGRKKGAPDGTAERLEGLRAEPRLEPFDGPLDAPVERPLGHQQEMFPQNPYDVGGHVTASDQGRPSTIDNPQGDLFGGAELEAPARALPETPVAAATPDVVLPTPDNPAMAEAFKKAETEQAYKEVAAVAEVQKEAHYQQLEDLAIAKRAGEIDYRIASKELGDKTLMADDATASMVKSIRESNLVGAMEAISKNHTNGDFRKLADYLATKLDGVTVKFHDESMIRAGERNVSGYFDPNTSTVGFSGVGATSPHTVLHETVHALTSQFMQARPNDVRVMGLKNLYNKMPAAMAKEFPGIVNAREFVSEAFSNPEFQKFLKSQRMDNRTMWTRFVDGVKNMLGLRPGTKTPLTNALDHAMDLGKQVIEASDAPTRQSIMENFREAGMTSRMADLMATPPKGKHPIETRRNENVVTVRNIPGLEHAVSDFAFYDKPISEIIEMAKIAPDIPSTGLEKTSHQLQAGALFESLKTRNPIVKTTYERITRATQEATLAIKKNLTDPVTGLKAYMRDLTPDQKGEIHSIMMMNEGQRVLSGDELAQAGMSEKQIAYYNKQREIDNQFFDAMNARRAELGMLPIDRRVAHIAGRFMGDFSRIVTAKVPHPVTGNLRTKMVGRIAGSTKRELNRASEYIKKEHPDWEMGDHQYNKIGKGQSAADRFTGLMEAINFLSKADADVKGLMDSYQGYLQSDAVNYLNATRHAKAKVKEAGGVVGSEGHKPWLDTVKNAEEGMKAQLAYFDQGYQWMAMEKAVHDLKPLLGDETLIKQAPNAMHYAKKYVEHAMNRNQGVIADAANSIISYIGSTSGFGHSNILKMNNDVKHLVMQKFMGLLNVPFTVTQLLQPFQTHPALVTLLHNRGLEFSSLKAQVAATETYLAAVLDGTRVSKLSDFDRSAMKYANEMGVFDVKMTDHTKNINVSKLKEGYDKIADVNITAPEHLTRGMSFLFYSHALKDAGVPVKDIFGAAENMTNMTMVNYHPIERPMGYAKLGWLGDVASTLTRYKHNQFSQAAFYAREGIRADQGIKSSVPLATFMGSSLAFGGIMGFFAFQEADAMYQLFMEKIAKQPDSLTNVVLNSGMPEVLTHGIFSTLGLDMTTRFSSANVIPNSIPEALLPYGSAVLDVTQSTGRWAMDPTSPTKFKQFVKSAAPQSAQGLLENQLFTENVNGKNLYINSTDGPNLGRGRVERSEGDMALRDWGFRNIRESKELSQNYANSQIEKGHANITEKLLSKAKYDAMDGGLTPARLKELIQESAKHGESPDAFISKLTQWSIDRKLPQSQQQMIRNANKGFKGAFNLKEQQR